jgi:cytochrome c oxidase assembly protein subunit 11
VAEAKQMAQRQNYRAFGKLALVAVAMFGFGYLLVPIYDVICEITGLNGKTGRISETEVAASYQADLERTITVQFVANNSSDMPWDFAPVTSSMKVHPGQMYGTYFVASNRTERGMTGQAVPSVSPTKASRYFNKTECFCFDQQPLAAGETKEMPLRFIVDPRLPKQVETLTLAYTLFDVTQQQTAIN